MTDSYPDAERRSGRSGAEDTGGTCGNASTLSGTRNLGIDLLRIVCMFLICVLHVCGQGGAMMRRTGQDATWYSVYILETAAYCAVDTYGMISGYVGITSRRRPARIMELWMRVFWYSALGTALAVFGFHLPVSEDTVWKAVFPTMWGTYWYFSGYVGVFVIAPYLNRVVSALSDTGKRKLMLTLFLLFSVFTMVPRASETGKDFLGIGAGYSFLWLAVLYVIGACARETETFFRRRSSGFYAALYAVCVFVTWGSKILLENRTASVYGKPRYGRLLFSYAGPTVVICAFSLLMIFSRMKIRRNGLRGAVRFLSPLAFSVYLIQVQPYVWTYVLKGEYAFISGYGPAAACLLVLAWSAVLYLECTAVDLIRAVLFRLLRIRRVSEAVTGCLLRPFRKLFGEDTDGSS